MAAVRGRLEARQAAWDMALWSAWQTERFAREDKLRPFRHYLKTAKSKPRRPGRQTPAEMLSIFRTVAASGVPLKIERIGLP